MKTLNEYMKMMIEPAAPKEPKPKKRYRPLDDDDKERLLYVTYAYHDLCEYEGIFKVVRIIGATLAVVLWTLLNMVGWVISIPIGVVCTIIALFTSKNSDHLMEKLKGLKWFLYPFEAMGKLC